MSIEVFKFGGTQVRTAGTPESPLFCALDVCRVLGYEKPDAAYRRLDQDECEVVPLHGGSSINNAVFVTESGLYTLIIGSKKPESKRFRRWVTHEVLPSIRKTGSYGRDITKALEDPAQLRQLLLDNVEKVLALQGEVDAARPKVEVYDKIIDVGDTLGFREAAKLIKEATGASESEVREFMFRAKWLQRLGGRLAPMHYGQSMGYVTVRERDVIAGDGGAMVICEARVTPKGVARAIERLSVEAAE